MAKSVSYAELIGGRYFNVALAWNGKIGNPLYAPGKAEPKDPKDYKIVGQPIKREDVAPLVFAQFNFCTDVKVPGMVHGRMIRPAIAGAMPVSVDESSIKDIPSAARGVEPRLSRRRRRQGMGRDQGCAAAQGDVVECGAAISGSGFALRSYPQGAGAQAGNP